MREVVLSTNHSQLACSAFDHLSKGGILCGKKVDLVVLPGAVKNIVGAGCTDNHEESEASNVNTRTHCVQCAWHTEPGPQHFSSLWWHHASVLLRPLLCVQVCAAILDPTLKTDPLLSRSADERSRAAFLHVLGLVDSLPHRISLLMEPWYRVSGSAVGPQLFDAFHAILIVHIIS